MTGEWVFACLADQAWIEDLDDVDIIEDAGEGEAGIGLAVDERPLVKT